jgi:addiction module HigA family antidote
MMKTLRLPIQVLLCAPLFQRKMVISQKPAQIPPESASERIMKTNKLPPIHPGEILREEFMKPRGLSQNALARALNVPPRRINEIVLEKRGITADTALRLARFFGTSAEMWAGLQADYDLRLVRYEKARTIEREVEPLGCVEPVPA